MTFRHGWTYKDASLYRWEYMPEWGEWSARHVREEPIKFNKKTDVVIQYGMENDVYAWVNGRNHMIYGIVYSATRSKYDVGHPVTLLRLYEENDRVLFKLFFHDWEPSD